ncbi:MAG: hypothetical protein E7491_07680 [Ruminococcaceae bacterium]|nr:hypothetical protein [Oscillospiraceae bacterium]
MSAIKIEFKSKCDTATEVAVEEIYWYLACLYKNGQIFSDYQLIKGNGDYFAIVLSPEDDSLEKSNEYVNEIFESLQQWFNITYQIVGECADFAGLCSCSELKDFVLHRRYGLEESPIKCADCGKSVPLYTLPYIMDEQEYFTVLQWQKAYAATEKLWMIGMNDQMMARELSCVSSELNLLGKNICKELETKTSKRFYYCIKQDGEKNDSVCASCRQEIRMTNAYYLCEKCGLAMEV